MRRFKHFDARTVDEAVSLLRKYDGKAKIIAGGTDIVGVLKDDILPEQPEALINIKTIPGLDAIKDGGGMLRIGPLVRLEDIAHHEVIKSKYPALALAARYTASPHIREMGTLGGNICQNSRCWYYRVPNDRFKCVRKGGEECFASEGDNRYHSIFGDVKDCVAVHPSDTAPALIVLGAKVKTSKRTIEMVDLYQDKDPTKITTLADDEILVEIQIPEPETGAKSTFIKFALRKSIDFPMVNCAAMVVSDGKVVKDVKICLNAVYIKPWEPTRAEDYLKGKSLSAETADATAAAAVWGAKPLSMNEYKIQIAKTLVKRALLACG